MSYRSYQPHGSHPLRGKMTATLITKKDESTCPVPYRIDIESSVRHGKPCGHNPTSMPNIYPKHGIANKVGTHGIANTVGFKRGCERSWARKGLRI